MHHHAHGSLFYRQFGKNTNLNRILRLKHPHPCVENPPPARGQALILVGMLYDLRLVPRNFSSQFAPPRFEQTFLSYFVAATSLFSANSCLLTATLSAVSLSMTPSSKSFLSAWSRVCMPMFLRFEWPNTFAGLCFRG